MACGICGDILHCNHSDEARLKFGFDMLGGKECPNCLTDFCEYHFQKYHVGSDQWKQGCPYCVNPPNLPNAHLYDSGELSPEFLQQLKQIIPEDEIERIKEFEKDTYQQMLDSYWNEQADDDITVEFDFEEAIIEGKEDPEPPKKGFPPGNPIFEIIKQNEEEK